MEALGLSLDREAVPVVGPWLSAWDLLVGAGQK